MKSYQSLIKKLAQRQIHRHPTHLWIIVDDRSISLTKHLSGINVLHLSDKSFEYAFEALRENNVLGKDSLIIFMCGIYSVVNSVLTVCANVKNCSNKLIRHSLKTGVTSSVLIYKALTLHKNILDSTINDQVIFCELIPFYLLKVYKCGYHIHLNDITFDDYKNYIKVIEEYNSFITDHSRICGFDKWNLIINAYPIEDDVSNSLCDTYDYDQIDCVRASEFISRSAKELFESLKIQSEKSVVPAQLQEEQAIDMNRLQPSNPVKRKGSEMCASSHMEILHEVVPDTKDGTETFEKIVIITLPEHAEYEFFRNEKVSVIVIQTFDFSGILSLLQGLVESHPRKTLYLLVASILWNASYEDYIPCTRSSLDLCSPGLSVLVPNYKYQFSDIVNKGKESLRSLITEVDQLLKSGSAFCILPPPPPILLDISINHYHLTFHKVEMDSKMEFYFSIGRAIKYFKSTFTSFSKLLISLTIFKLKKCGISARAFADYENLTINWNYHLNSISYETLTQCKEVQHSKFSLWLNAITVLIQDCLSPENNCDLRDILSAMKNSAKRQRTENNSNIKATICKSEPTVTNSKVSKLSDLKNAPYDHIVFVGFCEKQLDLLPVDGNSRGISLITIKPTFEWDDLDEKFKSMKSLVLCESILFIIIGSVKLVMNEFTLFHCLNCKCQSPVSCSTLNPKNESNFVVKKLRNINRLIYFIGKQFINRSEVALILLPTVCAEIKTNNHEALHGFMDKLNNPYLAIGGKQTWSSVGKELEICWNEKMYSQFGKSQKLKRVMPQLLSLSEAISVLHWIDDGEASLADCYVKETQKCKTLLKNLITTANPSIQLTKEWQSSSNKTSQRDYDSKTLRPYAKSTNAKELSFRDQKFNVSSSSNKKFHSDKKLDEESSKGKTPHTCNKLDVEKMPYCNKKPNVEKTSHSDRKPDVRNSNEKTSHSNKKSDLNISVKTRYPDKESDIKLLIEKIPNLNKKADLKIEEKISHLEKLPSDKKPDVRISLVKTLHIDNKQDLEASIEKTSHSNKKLDSEISVEKLDVVISAEKTLLSDKKSYEEISEQKIMNSFKKLDNFISEDKIPHSDKKSIEDNISIPPPHFDKKLDEDVAISKPSPHIDKKPDDVALSKPPPHCNKKPDEYVTFSKPPPNSDNKKLDEDVTISKPPLYSDKKPVDDVVISKPIPHSDKIPDEDVAISKPPLDSDNKPDDDVTISKLPHYNDFHQDISKHILDISEVDINSHKIPFKYVYILSKRDLSSVLDVGNSENIEYVQFNPFLISEKEVPALIKKFGSISYNSVCFLALDLFCLANETDSLVCKNLRCEKPISIMTLKTGNDVDEEAIHSYLLNKIGELKSFITKLSIYLPVVILPFSPVGAFCDNENDMEHKLFHVTNEINSYVVSGTKEYWETFSGVAAKLWCNVMKSNNEKYFVLKEFQKYITENYKHIVFENDLKKFASMYPEISIWKHILEAFLKILLSDSDEEKQTSVNCLEKENSWYPTFQKKNLTLNKVAHSDVENSPKSTCQKLFDRAVIITTLEFVVHMEKLKSSKVEIVYVKPNNIDEATLAIKDHQKNAETNSTLWLMHTEVLGFTRTKLSTLCSSCPKPLEVVSPSEQWLTSSKIIKSFHSLIKDVNIFLNSNSSLVILPLFPLTIFVVHETKHHSNHTFDNEDKIYNLTTAKSVGQFRILYSELQEQFKNFFFNGISKFNGASQFIESYKRIYSWNFLLDVVTDEDLLNRLDKLKKQNQWVTYVSKFLSDNIKPASDDNKFIESKSINDTKRKLIPNASKCLAVSSFKNQSIDSRKCFFDHTVFICFCEEHCELIYIMEENLKNISVILVKNSLEWVETKRKIKEILPEFFNKILFIIIGCVNLIGNEVQETLCLQEKCRSPVFYLDVKKMDKETLCTFSLIALRTFLSNLRVSFKNSSVLLGPLFPMKYSPKFFSSGLHHDIIHKAAENQIYPIADKQKWSAAAEEFETQWSDEMLRQLNRVMCAEKAFQFSNIIKNFKALTIPSIYWVEPKNTSNRENYGKEIKMFLKNFINIACAPVKSDSQNLVCLVPTSAVKKSRGKSKPRRQNANLPTEHFYKWQVKIMPEELEEITTGSTNQAHVKISGCNNETLSKSATCQKLQEPNIEYSTVNVECNNQYKADRSNQVLSEYSTANYRVTNGILSDSSYVTSGYPAVSCYTQSRDPVFYSQVLNVHSVPNNQASNAYSNNCNAGVFPDVTSQTTNMYLTGDNHMSGVYSATYTQLISRHQVTNDYPAVDNQVGSEYLAGGNQMANGYPAVNTHVAGDLNASGYPAVSYQAGFKNPAVGNQPTSEYSSISAWIASGYPEVGNQNARGYLTAGNWVGSEYAAANTQVTSGHPAIGTQVTSGYPAVSNITNTGYPAFENQVVGYPTIENQVVGYPAVGNQISSCYQAVNGEIANGSVIGNQVINYQANVTDPPVDTWLNSGQHSLISNGITNEYPALGNQVTSEHFVDNQTGSKYPAVSNQAVSDYPMINQVAASVYPEVCQMVERYPVAYNKIEDVFSLATDQTARQYKSICNEVVSWNPATSNQVASGNKELKSQSDISINLNLIKEENKVLCKSNYDKSPKQKQDYEKYIKLEPCSGISSPSLKKISYSRSPRLRSKSRSRSRKSSFSSRRLRSRSRSTDYCTSSYSKRLRTRSPSERCNSSLESKHLCSRSNFVKKENELKFSQRSDHDLKKIYEEYKFQDSESFQNVAPKAIENFSLDVALDLLERVGDKVGILGEAAKGLATSIKLELKINRNRAFNLINEEDNALLIQIVVDKLEDSLRTATTAEIPTISKAIEWISYLIEYAKNNPSEIKLNIKAIAVAAMNKTAKATMDLIRTAFEYERGRKPTEEEINEVFIQVCALQFEMVN